VHGLVLDKLIDRSACMCMLMNRFKLSDCYQLSLHGDSQAGTTA